MCQARNWLLGFLALSVGCDSLGTTKVDNPVVGPPPPRINVSDSRLHDKRLDRTAEAYAKGESRGTAKAYSKAERGGTVHAYAKDESRGGLEPTSGNEPASPEIADNAVVATVNGSPIFAYEILERYTEDLGRAQQQASAADMNKFRAMLIKRDLQAHIERKLLADTFKSSLKKEQQDKLNGQLDKMFEKEIQRLEKDLKVSSQPELELKLKEHHTTLASLRRTFDMQRMSMLYLNDHTPTMPEIGRPELLAYYQAHADDYVIASRVKWQEIKIAHEKHGGKQKAEAVLEEAVADLKQGMDFGEVARKYSDGPTASKGGNWGWTQKGSLADSAVEKALFETVVGQISPVISCADAYDLVKVIDREQAGRVPLAKAQDDIKKKLQSEAKDKAVKGVLDKLQAAAVVETIFDRQPNPG